MALQNSTKISDLHEMELFSHCTWQELFEQAQSAHVPYFSVAVCFIKNPKDRKALCKIYDAINFSRYVAFNHGNIDPLTQLNIEKVEYRYLKTSTYDMKTHRLILNTAGEFCSFTPPTDFRFADILFEANNYWACEKDRLKIAVCQYVFGSYLIAKSLQFRSSRSDLSEALRWLHCSALSGCESAQVLLTQFMN